MAGYDVETEAHQVRQLIGLAGQYASVDEMLTEGDQPPVPAVITLTESRLTDDDAHPVDL